MNHFKLNLKYLRGNKKLNQKELSEELSVKRTSVANWEYGTSYPNMDILFRIVEYFEVTLDEFLLTNMVVESYTKKDKSEKLANDLIKIKELEASNLKCEEIINLQTKTIEKQADTMKRNAESIEKLVGLLEMEKKGEV